MDLLTIALLLSPIDLPVPHTASRQQWASLKRVALAAEVVGPSEKWAADYRTELAYCRTYYRNLRGTPPICESLRFPEATGRIAWIERRIDVLKNQRRLFLYLDAAIEAEGDHLRECLNAWLTLRDAQGATTYPARRWALSRLREQIGLGAWFAGEMPR